MNYCDKLKPNNTVTMNDDTANDQRRKHIFKLRSSENPPWVVWRIWSRDIHDLIKQHIEDDHVLLSYLFVSKMIYNKLNAWGLPFDPKENFFVFEVVDIRKLEERNDDGATHSKVIIKLKYMKCADSFSNPPEEWRTYAFNDLAEVLNDALKPKDHLLIWGGRVQREAKKILLNLAMNTTSCPKSYLAIYRHDEIEPLVNGNKQFNIPFHSRGVYNSFIKQHGLEDSTVQKICPAIYPTTTETVELLELENIIIQSTNDDNRIQPNVIHKDDKNNNVNTNKLQSDKPKIDSKNDSFKSKSKSSVSQVVHTDVGNELNSDIDGEETSCSSSNLNLNNKSSIHSKESGNSKIQSKVSKPEVLPLTRRNIRLHTESQDIVNVTKETNHTMTNYISDENEIEIVQISDQEEIDDPTSYLPKENSIQSAASRQKQPNSPRSEIEDQNNLTTSSKDKQESPIIEIDVDVFEPQELSQNLIIGLESQVYSLEIGETSRVPSQNNQSNAEELPPIPSPLLSQPEPGMSQYSTGRLLNEMDENRNSLELGDDNDSGSCKSDTTVERDPCIISTKRLCELNRIRVFHLRCKIHKRHVDQADNIIILRVSDGTIAPFPSKELWPLALIQPTTNNVAKLMAILEIDILIRNANKIKGWSTQSEEVKLLYVTIEKDPDNNSYFTMDGNRSEIQEVVGESPQSEVGESVRGQKLNNNGMKIPATQSTSAVTSDIDKNLFNKISSSNATTVSNNGQNNIQMKKAFVMVERLDMTGMNEGCTVNLSQFSQTPSAITTPLDITRVIGLSQNPVTTGVKEGSLPLKLSQFYEKHASQPIQSYASSSISYSQTSTNIKLRRRGSALTDDTSTRYVRPCTRNNNIKSNIDSGEESDDSVSNSKAKEGRMSKRRIIETKTSQESKRRRN